MQSASCSTKNTGNFSASLALPTVKTKAERVISRQNEPTVEGVFRIVIQRSFKGMVDLPEVRVWNVLPKTIQARMLVRIRRYGFFFTHNSNEVSMRCVLTRRNYLIVYAKERLLKGYAVKLSLAEKLSISCMRTEKNRCTVTIKWGFGEITLLMAKDQVADWRTRILEAFEGISLQSDKANVGVQTINNVQVIKKTTSLPKILETGNCTLYRSKPVPLPQSNGFINASVLLKKENNKLPHRPILSPQRTRPFENLAKIESPIIRKNSEKTINAPTFSAEMNGTISHNISTLENTDASSIDYSTSTHSFSRQKSFLADDQPSKPSFLPKSNLLRRSWSSSVLDYACNKFVTDNLFEESKLVVPRRTIGRIERPITLPNSHESTWFTLVKRYGFEEKSGSTAEITHIDASSALITTVNSENVQKACNNFRKKIAHDQAVIGEQKTLSWSLPQNARNGDIGLNLQSDTNNNTNFFWRRHFFESDV